MNDINTRDEDNLMYWVTRALDGSPHHFTNIEARECAAEILRRCAVMRRLCDQAVEHIEACDLREHPDLCNFEPLIAAADEYAASVPRVKQR